MKKIIIISLLLMCFLTINSAFANSDIEYFPQNQPPSIIELAFLRDYVYQFLKPCPLTMIINYSHMEELKKTKEINKMTIMMLV
ncbi:hypothetical protein GY31_14830 [Lysinibacillus sphaericus]|nr:hypothetical protein GY31_14830 [Lysinibacillus sphaericus]